MTYPAPGENDETIWREHCRSAVRKFLMNAVVIDNQPLLEDKRHGSPDSNLKPARKIDDGMGGSLTEEADEKTSSKEKNEVGTAKKADVVADENQDLNVRKISDAFAREQIACAFVLPEDGDSDEKSTLDRIVAAAVPSDIIIIDWYLRDKNPTLTQKVLQHIAKEDLKENGRMRLICIYTGIKNTGEVTRVAVEALETGGLETKKRNIEEGTARGNHHCLVVLNKQDVDSDELPNKILEVFTDLSDGLLPSFALAAVAAIRRNMHHIITRFSKDLDSAYVANRLITNPQDDVAKLIRELFVSECDTALGLEKVADKFLESDIIELWLNYHKQPKDESCKFKKSKN